MSNEQPTIGKIEQLTTTTEQERIERIKALRGKYANQFPPSDQRDKGELDRLRAENARLQTELDEHRSALILIRDMPLDAAQSLERCKGYARATLKKWAEPYVDELKDDKERIASRD